MVILQSTKYDNPSPANTLIVLLFLSSVHGKASLSLTLDNVLPDPGLHLSSLSLQSRAWITGSSCLSSLGNIQ